MILLRDLSTKVIKESLRTEKPAHNAFVQYQLSLSLRRLKSHWSSMIVFMLQDLSKFVNTLCRQSACEGLLMRGTR